MELKLAYLAVIVQGRMILIELYGIETSVKRNNVLDIKILIEPLWNSNQYYPPCTSDKDINPNLYGIETL